MLFVSSRAFSLSTPTFLLSTPAENSKATWKKATKCNKIFGKDTKSVVFPVLNCPWSYILGLEISTIWSFSDDPADSSRFSGGYNVDVRICMVVF